MSTKRKILIPIDSSANCKRAFNWYVTNVKNAEDLVIFVHIVEPTYTSSAMALDGPTVVMEDITSLMKNAVADGKKVCQEFQSIAKTKGIESRAFIHVDTRPGPAIVKACQDHSANLIVIGNRGVGTFRRAFIGSVSDYVLHNAQRPIIIVPPEPSK